MASVACFGVRVSMMFSLMFVHFTLVRFGLLCGHHFGNSCWPYVLIVFFAHLSRRLTGELIGYPCSGFRSQFQTSSPLKPLGQSKPNYMWSNLDKGGTKVYINDQGHMTKMAAMPIYNKNLLLQNHKSYDLETWHVISGTQALQSLY